MNYEIQDMIDVALDKLNEQMEKYDISSKIEEAEEAEW
jgi:hypothetical protein